MRKNPKLFVRTLGCQMNVYDSNKIIDLLAKTHRMTETKDEQEADLFVINTCSIRENAAEKLFHQLGRWKKYKDKNSNVLIAVGGCVASQEGKAMYKRAPYIDIVFGPQTLHRLPHMLNVASKNKQQIDIAFPEIEKFDYLPKANNTNVSAYVSIMEGCSKYCSFCVVPYTRGEEVSRPLNDVIDEIDDLTKKGVKEINLLGQNVNCYQGEYDGHSVDLPFLIETINQMPLVKRIRYTTSHPVHFSDALINCYNHCDKLVSHLHLPIQSGSDKVLALMKRGHTALEYKSKIRKLKAIRPDIALSSDFIVGFPNETEDDFNKTLEIVNEIGFDKSFSFIYSKRPGTPAANYVDDISHDVKKQRLQLLQDVLSKQSNVYAHKMLHQSVKVLVEGKSPIGNTICGRTENNRVVHFDGSLDLIGQLISVHITQINSNSLLGELIH